MPLARDVGPNSAGIHTPRARTSHDGDVPSDLLQPRDTKYAQSRARARARARFTISFERHPPASRRPSSLFLAAPYCVAIFFTILEKASPLSLHPLHPTIFHCLCTYSHVVKFAAARGEGKERSTVYGGTAVSFRNGGGRGVPLCKQCTRGGRRAAGCTTGSSSDGERGVGSPICV